MICASSLIGATANVEGKMSSKFGSRYRGAFLCMFCLALVQVFLSRAVADDAAQELILFGIGNGKTSLGHDMSFRDYKSSDGTTGRVELARCGSLQAAQRQIGEWTKLATAIKGREHYDDESNHGFNDRILAEWKSSTDQGSTLVIIIRRDKLTWYHIVSPSKQVAKQIEQLIDAAPDKVSRRP
ncbi:MAG: hypothetical protein WB679_19305 [Terracidiphilus sp.]